MSIKLKIKIVVDIFMTIALLASMGYIVTGDPAHEIIGTVTACLWIMHTVMNRKWYTSLVKGQYNLTRIINTAANILLLFSAAGLILSGIILSSHVFRFLGIETGMAFARILHMVSVYWYFVLSSLHLGLHWNKVIRIIRQSVNKNIPKLLTVLLNAMAVSASCFGIYVFIQQQLALYMFMRTFFVFFDFEKPTFVFFFEYFCMMVLFASAAYYFSILSKYIKSARRQKCLIEQAD